MKNNTCCILCYTYTSCMSRRVASCRVAKRRLQIATLLALRALTHGIAQLGRWVLLLQLTVHLHDLFVPIRSTLRNLAGLSSLLFVLLTRLSSLLLALLTRLSSLLLALLTRLSSLLLIARRHFYLSGRFYFTQLT